MELESNRKVRKITPVISFAIEIEKTEQKLFESHYHLTLDNERKLYRQYYETFIDRLRNYTKNFDSDKKITNEEKTALNIIFSTVLSKLVATKRQEPQLNGESATEYFDNLVSQLTTTKVSQKKTLADEECKVLKSNIDRNLLIMEKFITEIVTPGLENAKKETEEATGKLLHEIKEIFPTGVNNLERNLSIREKLKAGATKKIILETFDFITSIFSMLVSKGQVAVALIKSRESVTTKPVIQSIMNEVYEDFQHLINLVAHLDDQTLFSSLKRDQFSEEILLNMKLINEQLNNTMTKLQEESQMALSIKKWKTKGMLKNIRGFIGELTQVNKITEVFRMCYETIEEALLLLVKTYDNLEMYEEKKELAYFFANKNGEIELAQYGDMELKNVLSSLEFYTTANLFIENYHKALYAFQQWTFPFVNRYLNEIKLDIFSKNISTVIISYTNEVQELGLALQRYIATTVKGDEYSVVKFFTSDDVYSKPFYKWSNENWQGAIKKLLTGEPIHLKADVDMRDQDYAFFFKHKSAIKFTSVALVLKTRDQSRQSELDKTLNHFQMSMTHSGISLYKVMGQHFVIYDRSITYNYSFERIKDNTHALSSNRIKYKVNGLGADFLMSPYTWWTFQIFHEKVNGLGFRNLEQFENEIDLELEGIGVYLDETKVSPQVLRDLQLNDYYETCDPTKRWSVTKDDNEDKCEVERVDMSEETTEIKKPEITNETNDIWGWNTISFFTLIFFSTGVVLLMIMSGYCFKKKYFLGYILVPLRPQKVTKNEYEQDKNGLKEFK